MTPTEVELKLLLPGADAATVEQRLRQIRVLARLPGRTQWLWNRYFDTPDHALQGQRCALRLRCVSDSAWPETGTPTGHWIQTFKTAGISVGGLSQRGEWETPVQHARLDPDALAQTPWGAMDPTQRLFRQLIPVFDTRCRRTTWQVRQRDGSQLELALDVGEIVAGDQVLPLLEIELELQQGAPASLFAFARQIARVIAVLPSDASKAERGYALDQGHLHAPRRALPVRLPASTTPRAAAQAAMAEMLEQWTRNLAGLCHADHPELVHQARVAWRRWRSASRLFAPWLHDAPPRQDLRPLLDALGRLRDLDVVVNDTLPLWLSAYIGGDAARGQQAAQAMQQLQQAAEEQRIRVRQLLARPATGRALLQLTEWLHGLQASPVSGSAEAASTAAVDWARRRMDKLHRRLERAVAASRAAAPSETELHQTRLLAKRSRYNVETLLDLLPGKKSRRWLREASRIQSRIGADRDLARASELLQELTLAPDLAEFLRGAATARKIQG